MREYETQYSVLDLDADPRTSSSQIDLQLGLSLPGRAWSESDLLFDRASLRGEYHPHQHSFKNYRHYLDYPTILSHFPEHFQASFFDCFDFVKINLFDFVSWLYYYHYCFRMISGCEIIYTIPAPWFSTVALYYLVMVQDRSSFDQLDRGWVRVALPGRRHRFLGLLLSSTCCFTSGAELWSCLVRRVSLLVFFLPHGVWLSARLQASYYLFDCCHRLLSYFVFPNLRTIYFWPHEDCWIWINIRWLPG